MLRTVSTPATPHVSTRLVPNSCYLYSRLESYLPACYPWGQEEPPIPDVHPAWRYDQGHSY